MSQKCNEEDWVFQQDNASIQTLKLAMGWFNHKKVALMKWSDFSSDLNLIGNLWVILSYTIYTNRGFDSAQELMEANETCWHDIPIERLRMLIGGVEAQVRAVPRDWCRAVRPAIGDQVVFTTKRTQTPPGRFWVLVGATRAQPTEKGVGELTGCHPIRKRASNMADPVKGRAEPEAGYGYKARCAPAVIGRRTRYRSTSRAGAGLGS